MSDICVFFSGLAEVSYLRIVSRCTYVWLSFKIGSLHFSAVLLAVPF